jgi:hypothetical protein
MCLQERVRECWSAWVQPLFFYLIQPDSLFLLHVAGRVTAVPYYCGGEAGKAGCALLCSASASGTPHWLSTWRQVNFKIPLKKWRTPSQPRYPHPGMAYHSNGGATFLHKGNLQEGARPGGSNPAAGLFREAVILFRSPLRGHGSAWRRAGVFCKPSRTSQKYPGSEHASR